MVNRFVLNETSYHGQEPSRAFRMKLRVGDLRKRLYVPTRI